MRLFFRIKHTLNLKPLELPGFGVLPCELLPVGVCALAPYGVKPPLYGLYDVFICTFPINKYDKLLIESLSPYAIGDNDGSF